ncbi:hypothetical protein B0H16DRAFT_1468067 [Mycena metata]|uniref:Uncharacterized protein n=1 Tax=Mycena metata TaxID=1033252 RepID=A0AAD7I3V8_9AGAR|nr:hypothetical protein B0H16DRAFT_1468067 [Mycena metata]
MDPMARQRVQAWFLPWLDSKIDDLTGTEEVQPRTGPDRPANTKTPLHQNTRLSLAHFIRADPKDPKKEKIVAVPMVKSVALEPGCEIRYHIEWSNHKPPMSWPSMFTPQKYLHQPPVPRRDTPALPLRHATPRHATCSRQHVRRAAIGVVATRAGGTVSGADEGSDSRAAGRERGNDMQASLAQWRMLVVARDVVYEVGGRRGWCGRWTTREAARGGCTRGGDSDHCCGRRTTFAGNAEDIGLVGSAEAE